MATKVEERTYEDAVQYLRDHGFDLIEAPGTAGRVFRGSTTCRLPSRKMVTME